MKYWNKLTHFAWLCLLPLIVVGCTDWDDHYDVENQKVQADKTLWEEIESRPQLAEYKTLLEQYGYKEMLNGTQMYTVFAPAGAIDIEGLSGEKIRTEVLENHIARFVYSANNATNDKEVITLNSKSVLFTRSGEGYTFGENKLTEEYNIIAKNGVLHVIEGQQKFFHNIWEYLTTDARFDSICNYLYSFNEDYLDEDKSVKGEINAEGKQEYLDSVIVSYNQMLSYLGQLNNEDSTYTMIVPTNEAWKEAYERIETYFQYPNDLIKGKKDSLQAYFTKQAMVRDLVFSHTVQNSMTDSLVSTTKGVFYNPFETILSEYADWDQAEKCSNGFVFVVDELKHKPWESWHKEIKVEAEDLRTLVEDKTVQRKIFYNKLGSNDTLYTKVSGGTYLEMQPTESNPTKYNIAFNIGNTLSSGAYKLKIVFLPQKLATTKNENPLSNLFSVDYSATADNGKLVHKGVSVPLTNDPFIIDTVSVLFEKPETGELYDEIILDKCMYGQDKEGMSIEIKNENSDGYSTTYLIDCIILEPVKE